MCVGQRDIVQFVPLRQFKGQHISALSRETLKGEPALFWRASFGRPCHLGVCVCVYAEVPDQLVQFCKMHKICPLRPRPAPAAAAVMPAVQLMPAGIVTLRIQLIAIMCAGEHKMPEPVTYSPSKLVQQQPSQLQV